MESLIKANKALTSPFAEMLANYQASRTLIPQSHKSTHWNQFPEHYDKVITDESAWACFLRNAISAGFNDDLLQLSGEFQHDSANWESRKSRQFNAVLPETVSDSQRIEEVTQYFIKLANLCGTDFLLAHLASAVGSPSCVELPLSDNQNQSIGVARTNIHDLSLVYYAWQVARAVQPFFNKMNAITKPLVVEIGGGFGGLVAKLKRFYPSARFVLLDLPETNAVSTYYLSQEFPNAKFILLNDFKQLNTTLVDFDFAILPGCFIDQIDDLCVDLTINTRSFMEMNPDIIQFYFQHIQRISKTNGIFACFNRYAKQVGDNVIAFKNYPFDDYWKMLLSQSGLFQNHIHELIVCRTQERQTFTIKDALISLLPI